MPPDGAKVAPHRHFSIGYGNRRIADFVTLLKRYGVRLLVDVRSKPYSRFQPDFGHRRLREHLERGGLAYELMGEALGGKPNDPAYYTEGKIDYAKLEAAVSFQSGLDRLLALDQEQGPLAVMCAELKPERCHRTHLIGRALSRRGVALLHIDETGELMSQDVVIARIAPAQGALF